jgi:hypothetical protein
MPKPAIDPGGLETTFFDHCPERVDVRRCRCANVFSLSSVLAPALSFCRAPTCVASRHWSLSLLDFIRKSMPKTA